MSRPEVLLQNYDALYNFYEQYEQNQLFARFGHFVLGQMYKPQVSYAEDGFAQEAIRNELDEDRRLALAANHLTDADQYALMSLIQREKVFHPFIGNSFMAAKASLFTRPPSKGGLVLRRALDGMGGIPVFRTEDVEYQDAETPTEITKLQQLARSRADDVQVARLKRGRHGANFLEGTRNRVDQTQVQPLKKGFAHTVSRAAKDVGVFIVPIGMYYGEPENYDKLDIPNKYSPNIRIGMPIRVDPALSAGELINILRPAMQDCVDVAVRVCLDRVD